MAELIHDIDPATVAANLEEVRALAGERVEILVATKYVPLEEMGKLTEAGVDLVGENRQQDLAAKRERFARSRCDRPGRRLPAHDGRDSG